MLRSLADEITSRTIHYRIVPLWPRLLRKNEHRKLFLSFLVELFLGHRVGFMCLIASLFCKPFIAPVLALSVDLVTQPRSHLDLLAGMNAYAIHINPNRVHAALHECRYNRAVEFTELRFFRLLRWNGHGFAQNSVVVF